MIPKNKPAVQKDRGGHAGRQVGIHVGLHAVDDFHDAVRAHGHLNTKIIYEFIFYYYYINYL